MKQLLHTPEGVRDIYNVECAKKLALQERLHKVLHLYGYEDIQTPTFEFFDVFRKEIGTISSKELYKFFDKEGNTLVLRPDITPSIARVAATLFEDQTFPIRLCYIENTFINHSSYLGRLKESTQLGAELINEPSVDADAEMLSLVIDCLKHAGLKEFQLTVGHAGFFQDLIEKAKMNEEDEVHARELISNRNFFGLDELLEKINVSEEIKQAFQALPELLGGVEILENAKKIALDEESLQAVCHLEEIYHILETYGVEKYVTFDLTMSGTYGYYTGIVFRGYTYGTGDAIVKGGRYDKLIQKFGKDFPSIGFAVSVEDLMNSLSRQKIEIPSGEGNLIVLYENGRHDEAVTFTKELRNEGKNVILIKKDQEKEISDYEEFGKKNMSSEIVFLQNDGQIKRIGL